MTAQRPSYALAGQWSERATSSRAEATSAPEFDHLNLQAIVRSQCSIALIREISDFLDADDTSHPFQWPQWSGEESQVLLLRRDERLQWFAQCGLMFPVGRPLRSIRALTVNRGPVCSDLKMLEAGLRQLIHEAASMGIAYVDIAPEWTGSFAESAAVMLACNGWVPLPGTRSSLRLSLSPSADELLASFRKTTRYEIRRSIGTGIDVHLARAESEYHEFLRLYRKMASQRKFSAEDSDFMIGIFQWLASEPRRGGLFVARERGKLCGGALVVRSGLRCWYVVAATSKEGKFGVGHLIQWRAIQWAKENGCQEYDFGGYREGATSGPALFKKGFCDRVVHFLPPHRYVVSPGRHRASELLSNIRRNLRRAMILRGRPGVEFS
jgi:hypothetical protein